MSEPVDIVAGALRGTYFAQFPKADADDWQSDAEFILARFQEYGWTLVPASEDDPHYQHNPTETLA